MRRFAGFIDPSTDPVHAVPQRTVWTRQPGAPVRLNRGHPLTVGLRVAVIPAVSPHNLADDSLWTTTAAFAKERVFGLRAGVWNVATANPLVTKYSNNALKEYSFVMLVHRAVVTTHIGTLITNRVAGNNGFVVHTQASGLVPNQIVGMQLSHGSVAIYSASGKKPINTQFLPVGLSAVIGSHCRYFLDGEFDRQVSITHINQSSSNIQFAREFYGVNGDYHFAVGLFWDRALSDNEMISAERNPWQIFA